MKAAIPATAQQVLDFWFRECTPAQWFARDDAFDDRIRQRFGALRERAAKGELTGWRATPHGALAEILLLDQFSRNIYRDDPRAFAADPQARACLHAAIRAGHEAALTPAERSFLYMPLMHSEDISDQRLSVRLFGGPGVNPQSLPWAIKHMEIIERFGRFPHRNAVLGRESTAEETEFLKQPGSAF